MIDKELIKNWRNIVKPAISSQLFKTNYEGMGEQDKEEFERDLDEILDLALIGLKYKTQLSQEGTTKDATFSCGHENDTISRQAAIDALFEMCDDNETENPHVDAIVDKLENLPSIQPVGKDINVSCKDAISRQDAIRWIKTECNPYGKPTLDFESGKRVMKHLEQMPSAQPEERTEKRTETYACD